MRERITGTLRVGHRVLLQAEDRALEVILRPFTPDLDWAAAVDEAVATFAPREDERVTLEGVRRGRTLLSEARLVPEALAAPDGAAPGALRRGAYRGTLEAPWGRTEEVTLRVEPSGPLVSADVSRGGRPYASLRARLREEGGLWVGVVPRVTFDWEDTSQAGGELVLESLPGGTLGVRLALPDAGGEAYSGAVSFHAEAFRTLEIEVDKLRGVPWPPEVDASDLPTDARPPEGSPGDLSIAGLFARAGVEARVTHNDGALTGEIGFRAGRPAEEDRWDERELHEMMDRHYSRPLDAREWWLYLLLVTRFDGGPRWTQGGFVMEDGEIVNDGRGTTGIIFDSRVGAIADPWTAWAEWAAGALPQYRHLFDFGREGTFRNTRPRQGVAVFWRELDEIFEGREDWDRSRRYLRTIMHELGHALNLAHAWLVQRPRSLSFMQYPQNYPVGGTYAIRDRNYWRAFRYEFDPEEVFHLAHGFYNEVVPGGRNDFMEWTAPSVFEDPSAGGVRANVALALELDRTRFRFAEPVTVTARLENLSSEPVALGRLSPAYGNVRYFVRRPEGRVQEYLPPLHKCEVGDAQVEGGASVAHTTSLTFGAHGFSFDVPGRYEVTAALPDPSTGAVVVSRPVSLWVGYPDREDEEVAREVFEPEAGMFLYLAGGEHLAKGKAAMQEVAAARKGHPFAAHANLVLGLNELAGHKSVVDASRNKKSDPEAALDYLGEALGAGQLDARLVERLENTVSLCEEVAGRPASRKGGKGRGKRGRGKKR